MKRIGLCLSLLLLGSKLLAHQPMALEELTSQFGMDLSSTEVTHEPLGDGLFVLFGAGGNVVVSIGEQGTLMVDSQFPQLIPKLKEKVVELGGTDITFTVNTHWHFDHADGNPMLGREGTWLVSQTNSRRMMVSKQSIDLVRVLYDQPPYPAEGLPVITYDDSMQFHFNGQTIQLMHFGPAHTTGDTAVYFRNGNVIHMGDVFNAGYPFIDAGNGGGLEGVIHFVESTLDRINEETRIVPGHGPVKSYDDMVSYLNMLRTVRDRVSRMIDDGMSLEQVLQAKPTEEFDFRYGEPTLLLNRSYFSLAKSRR